MKTSMPNAVDLKRRDRRASLDTPRKPTQAHEIGLPPDVLYTLQTIEVGAAGSVEKLLAGQFQYGAPPESTGRKSHCPIRRQETSDRTRCARISWWSHQTRMVASVRLRFCFLASRGPVLLHPLADRLSCRRRHRSCLSRTRRSGRLPSIPGNDERQRQFILIERIPKMRKGTDEQF
jgi:hypothetical protein